MRDEAAASASRFALSARGPPAGAWSKMAGSVDGTSNDTVGSTANGIRSPSDYAGAATTAFRGCASRKTRPRPPQPRRLKRATRRAGQRPAAAEGAGREGCVPLRKRPSLSSPGSRGPADGRARREGRGGGLLHGVSVAAAEGCPRGAPPVGRPIRGARGSTAREDKEFRRFLIVPPASEPADGRMRPDSQGILVFPFRTTPRRSRRARRSRRPPQPCAPSGGSLSASTLSLM